MSEKVVDRVNAETVNIIGIRHLRLNFGNLDIVALKNEGRDLSVFGAEISQSHGLNPEKKSLVMSTSVKFFTTQQEQILDYENEIAFMLENYEQVVQENENDTYVLPSILSQISTVCISTVRGILAEKMANTPYSKMYLPLVDDSFLMNG